MKYFLFLSLYSHICRLFLSLPVDYDVIGKVKIKICDKIVVGAVYKNTIHFSLGKLSLWLVILFTFEKIT